jgi:hypothetical protein
MLELGGGLKVYLIVFEIDTYNREEQESFYKACYQALILLYRKQEGGFNCLDLGSQPQVSP